MTNKLVYFEIEAVGNAPCTVRWIDKFHSIQRQNISPGENIIIATPEVFASLVKLRGYAMKTQIAPTKEED